MSEAFQNSPTGKIERLVHDLVVTVDELNQASRDVQTAPLVLSERNDIIAASIILSRLAKRLTPVVTVAAE